MFISRLRRLGFLLHRLQRARLASIALKLRPFSAAIEKMKGATFPVGVLTVGLATVSFADTATWNVDTVNQSWREAANWTPAIVPNGDDTAVLDVSNVSAITISKKIELEELIFNPGASGYSIRVDPVAQFLFHTVGITNNSGRVQNIVVSAPPDDSFVGTEVTFTNASTAGSQLVFTNEGGTVSSISRDAGEIFFDFASAGGAAFVNKGAAFPLGGNRGVVTFYGHSTAETAIITNEGGLASDASGGLTSFTETSTAADATIYLEGGVVAGALGGRVNFLIDATAGSATFIANGGQADGARGGAVLFVAFASAETGTFTINGASTAGAFGGTLTLADFSKADRGTFVINGGTGGGSGGEIQLSTACSGGSARMEVFGNGSLDISGHDAPGVTIGSLEGDGIVVLGGQKLTTGSNDLSTFFSGIIQDEGGIVIGSGGSLTKIGIGTLTLAGANTYTGGTTLSGGALKVNNATGSGTGPGPAQVDGGTLGGEGIIAGAVTVGTGSAGGAALQPGIGAGKPTTLTLQNTLTFKSDGTYIWKLNTKKAKADQVAAKGVTIETGARFDFRTVGNRKLTIGKTVRAISNTAVAAIDGTFANLADGSTVTVGANKFQVNYSGGDGNDLALTVVQ
jgi:autotransporter-associated beta strand protein